MEGALKAAVEAGKTETDKASSAFREAKEKLLQYRATVLPRCVVLRQIFDHQSLSEKKRSQELDSMIIEKMSRANEKDEHHLRLFNQLRERRGPIVRIRLCHKTSFTLILISVPRLRVHIPRMSPARSTPQLPRLPRHAFVHRRTLGLRVNNPPQSMIIPRTLHKL